MLLRGLSKVRLQSSIYQTRFFKERAGKSIRPGSALVLNGVPHRVTKMNQGKRGKGGGFIRATLKNLISSETFEKTFISDEVVEHADLMKEGATFSWVDGDYYVFYSQKGDFEEIKVSKDDISNVDFLKEGQEVKLLRFEDRVIGVDLPTIVEYKVLQVESENEHGGYVPATLDCPAKVMVPMFIGAGTLIRVNVDEGKYVEKVN